jgi:hypothetical protein
LSTFGNAQEQFNQLPLLFSREVWRTPALRPNCIALLPRGVQKFLDVTDTDFVDGGELLPIQAEPAFVRRVVLKESKR